MKLTLDGITLEGPFSDWCIYVRLIRHYETEHLLGILEHYSLEYWM